MPYGGPSIAPDTQSMARLMTRRAAITALSAALGGVLGLEFLLRRIFGSPAADLRLADGPGGGMMGVDPADLQTYMEMFSRHNEINRVVEEIPGGVRTTTE